MFKRGFTLIELIVVIAIIAVLAAIVAPSAFKSVEKAKVSGTVGDWKSIKTASMSYYSDVGSWPGNCSNSTNCSVGAFFNSTASGWDGPYLDKWPNGRWGGGDVSWNTSTSNNVFGPAAGERWIEITNVPPDSQNKTDTAIDGSIGLGTGSCRGSGTTLQILISRDGAVN